VIGNVKLGRAAARSGEWAQHFSNASCLFIYLFFIFILFFFIVARLVGSCRVVDGSGMHVVAHLKYFSLFPLRAVVFFLNMCCS